ncbi:Hypothetical protein R9X50_00768800 [Acrodontium crateriforme]|uniref:Zn(2)-C6 fungal-type domain-containing protein n=1 Tax=Acrodontium crateriforme TaxID=150365 RepID=A0AAQ3MBU5_9PEZI|nr:Hypothetical protein R9X50_00768800 [Acrodontium crateriforme]
MTYQPGRSKACITCLRRRKGCDKQKPTCERCLKSGFKCEGYDRPLVFRPAKQQLSTTKSRSLAPLALAQARGERSILLNDSLSHTAYQARVIGLFWSLYLPNGKALPEQLASISVGGWIEAMRESELRNSIVGKTLLSLALRLVGRRDEVNWMNEQSRRLYGEALHGVCRTIALRQPQGEETMLLLPAIRSLSLIEAIESTKTEHKAQNWQTHNLGEYDLFQMNPPSFYATGRAHQLFLDARLSLIMTLLIKRKKAFFAEAEWKTVPWLLNKKSPKDHLIDILCDIPSLYEQLDAFAQVKASPLMNKASPLMNKIKKQGLISTCRDLEARLTQWQTEFIYFFDTDQEELNNPCSTTCDPEILPAAHVRSIYWITGILIYTEWYDLLHDKYINIDKIGNSNATTEATRAYKLSTLYCRNILDSLTLFLHPAMGMYRLSFTSFQLASVQRFLRLFEGYAGNAGLEQERRLFDNYLAQEECKYERQLLASLEKNRSVVGGGV